MNVDLDTEVFFRRQALKNCNWTYNEFKNFSFAANSITGFRLDQEDRYTSLPSPHFRGTWSFFGIYDGHAGAVIAEYLKRKLHVFILEEFEKSGDIEIALDRGFQACDRAIRAMTEDEFNEIKKDTLKEFTGSAYQPLTSGGGTVILSDKSYNKIRTTIVDHIKAMRKKINNEESTEENDDLEVRRSKRFKKEHTAGCGGLSDETEEKNDEKKAEDEEIPLVGLSMGSTATAVIFTDKFLYVASVGDSRCVASHNRYLHALTCDHIPKDAREKQRILKSGHNVTNNRIDGVLNMSRAFGDYSFKDKKNLMDREQAVTAAPTITSISLDDLDFVVIATNGIWHHMKSINVPAFVEMSFHLPTEEIISETFDRVLWNRGLDNLTMIIIKNEERCAKVSEEYLYYLAVDREEEQKRKMEMKKVRSRKSKPNSVNGKKLQK